MSFTTDLELLAAHCKNSHLLERIRRRHDTRLLEYQLRKHHLKPTSAPHDPETQQTSTPQKPAVPQSPSPAVPQSRSQTIPYTHTSFALMPTPQTQDLWLKNRDDYKLMQHQHIKLKHATTNDERAEIRASVLNLHTQIRDRWALIDEEIDRIEKNDLNKETETPLKTQTIRSYITKALKRENLTDKQRLELQHRVDALLAANEPIKPETIERLKAKGILIELCKKST